LWIPTEKRSNLNNVIISLLMLKKTLTITGCNNLLKIPYMNGMIYFCETLSFVCHICSWKQPFEMGIIIPFYRCEHGDPEWWSMGLDCSRISHLPIPCNVSQIYRVLLLPFAVIVLSHSLICKKIQDKNQWVHYIFIFLCRWSN
jgi:hypothetical protein